MDDEIDLNKMIAMLNNTKEEIECLDCEDFIGSDDSDSELNLDSIANILDEESLSDNDTDTSKINEHILVKSISSEEQSLIDACEDVELKELLSLNRSKNITLICLYKTLQDLLAECKQYINEKKLYLKDYINNLKLNHQSNISWRLAAPYFKDKELYQSPPNEDTIRKKENNELFVYDLTNFSKWSTNECLRIMKAVKINYNFNKSKSLWTKDMKTEDPAGSSEKKIVNMIKNETLEVPPLNCNKFLDWGRISSVFIDAKRSEMECELIWQLQLHPSINKKPWTNLENESLELIVRKYNSQNWKQITLELGNNRSELSVCSHYFSVLSNQFKKGIFTYDEDMKLLRLVNDYKMGNFIQWSKVAKHFKNRTQAQLYHRYTYYLAQDLKLRSKFTKAEDIMLMICVDKFGKKFKKCSSYLPGRTMMQCKARYGNSLVRTTLKGNWTLEEDKLILSHVKEHGTTTWKDLAKKMLRTRGQLRQRHLRIMMHLESNPNADIKDMPKKGAKTNPKKCQENDYKFYRSIADRYLNEEKMPTLDEIRKILDEPAIDDGSNANSSSDDDSDVTETKEGILNIAGVDNSEVEDQLVDFFYGSLILPNSEVVDPMEYDNAVDDIESVLNSLNADLNIPDSITSDDDLDPLDIRILHSLNSRIKLKSKNLYRAPKVTTIQTVIPPNLHSVVGLRHLLLNHLDSKSKKSFVLCPDVKNPFSILKDDVAYDFSNCNTKDIGDIKNERNLFYQRFYALFKWPAVITLQKPTADLLNFCESIPEEQSIQVKRAYDCKSSEEGNPKRLKASEPCGVLKLTSVTSKSVIKHLMADKTKKLFSLSKRYENGQVKTVINEVKFGFNQETVVNNFSSSIKTYSTKVGENSNKDDYFMITPKVSGMKSSQDETTDVTDKDFQDLQKMQEFMKNEVEDESDSDY